MERIGRRPYPGYVVGPDQAEDRLYVHPGLRYVLRNAAIRHGGRYRPVLVRLVKDGEIDRLAIIANLSSPSRDRAIVHPVDDRRQVGGQGRLVIGPETAELKENKRARALRR